MSTRAEKNACVFLRTPAVWPLVKVWMQLWCHREGITAFHRILSLQTNVRIKNGSYHARTHKTWHVTKWRCHIIGRTAVVFTVDVPVVLLVGKFSSVTDEVKHNCAKLFFFFFWHQCDTSVSFCFLVWRAWWVQCLHHSNATWPSCYAHRWLRTEDKGRQYRLDDCELEHCGRWAV